MHTCLVFFSLLLTLTVWATFGDLSRSYKRSAWATCGGLSWDYKHSSWATCGGHLGIIEKVLGLPVVTLGLQKQSSWANCGGLS